MAAGKWQVMHQYAGDESFIRVYRLRNVGEPMHTGNIEFQPDIFALDAEAEAKAAELNGGSKGE